MKPICLFFLSLCSFLAVCQTSKEIQTNAYLAFDHKEYEKALRYIDQAIASDSTKGELWGKKGDILFCLKKDQEAIYSYSKAISLKPKDLAQLYLGRGNIYLSYQLINDAIEEFNWGLKYSSNDTITAILYMDRGVAKYRKRDFESSYKDLLFSYKMDTSRTYILSNLAMVCTNLHKNDEALKYLLLLNSAHPGDSTTILNLGFFYQNIGEYAKSVDYFNKAIIASPRYALAYSNRSYSLLKLGEFDKAMIDINKSIELYPGNSYAYRNRGLIFLEMKKYLEACKDFDTAIDKGYTQMYGKDVEEMIENNCSVFKK